MWTRSCRSSTWLQFNVRRPALSRPLFTTLAMQGSRKMAGSPYQPSKCNRRQEMASSKTAMPSEPLVSMTPAPAEEQETLLREAHDVADRLRLILDINNTIAAHLELEDLLHAVAAS